MTRYIDFAAAKKLVAEKDYKLGQAVVGLKAVAPVKGKEQAGTVVYRRKVEYDAPFRKVKEK
jgi:hypothetical protein